MPPVENLQRVPLFHLDALERRLEQGGPHVSVINSRVNGYGAEIERTIDRAVEAHRAA